MRVAGPQQRDEGVRCIFDAVNRCFLVQYLSGAQERNHLSQKGRHLMEVICDDEALQA